MYAYFDIKLLPCIVRHLSHKYWVRNRRVLELGTAFAARVNSARLDLILCFLLPREMSDYYRLEPVLVCLHINMFRLRNLSLSPNLSPTLKSEIPVDTSLNDCE